MEHREGIDYIASNDFQKSLSLETLKWDKEWLRYFSLNKDYSFYFYDMSNEDYALNYSPDQISKFSKPQMYHTKLVRNIKCHIWVTGKAVLGKSIFEIGCGPGILGRVCSRFTKDYIGLDISTFALSLARLTSPQNCQYIHYSDTEQLESLKNSVDLSVGRHFFIHHNFQESRWILSLLRYLTKKGGIISADFFSNPESLNGDRRRRCTDSINQIHPSTLYDFSDEDISNIGGEVGLELEDLDYQKDLETRFATFRV